MKKAATMEHLTLACFQQLSQDRGTDQPHSGNMSESSGTLYLVKKIYCHIILYIGSKMSTNNFVMQSNDIKYSGVITQKIEFIFLTPFIPENSKQGYFFKVCPQDL